MMWCGGERRPHLRSNPMQRYLRDVNVMSNHIVYDLDGTAG